MKNVKAKVILVFLCLIAIMVCTVSIKPYDIAFAAQEDLYTGEFVGYSGYRSLSDITMFNESNTYDYYKTFFPDGFRKLYNMEAKNRKIVYNGAPAITVFTHGYGADASHWSNNGTDNGDNAEFAYDAVSVIEKVSNKANGANKFWAVCNGNSFRLVDLSEQFANSTYDIDEHRRTNTIYINI